MNAFISVKNCSNVNVSRNVVHGNGQLLEAVDSHGLVVEGNVQLGSYSANESKVKTPSLLSTGANLATIAGFVSSVMK